MFLLIIIRAMDGRENSKVQHQHFGEHEQDTSYSTYPSFSLFSPNHHTHFNKLCPMFSTMECNELNNARAEADRGSSISSTSPSEDSSEEDGDALDEEVSLNELLLDGKTKMKIELLAAMVGVDTNEPAIVLTEVVRVLKVLKAISQ